MLEKKPARRMPALFVAIIENDERLKITKASPIVSLSDFKQQRADKREYIKSAEKIYAGAKNKGKEI